MAMPTIKQKGDVQKPKTAKNLANSTESAGLGPRSVFCWSRLAGPARIQVSNLRLDRLELGSVGRAHHLARHGLRAHVLDAVLQLTQEILRKKRLSDVSRI